MNPLHFECTVYAIGRRHTKANGDRVTISLHIHPNDVPESLWDNKLLHQRFMVALAQIGDDELPVGEKSFSYARQAGTACGKREFQDWLLETNGWSRDRWNDENRAAYTARLLRDTLNIASRKELDLVPEKQAEWIDLFNRYLETDRIYEKEHRNET